MPQTIVDRSARSQIGHARQSTCSVCATCIEDWVVVNGGSCPFEAPELRPIQIVGVVSNHPILGNGPITTTLVQMIDQARGVAHTLNTEYELGAPRAKFAAQLAMLGSRPAGNIPGPRGISPALGGIFPAGGNIPGPFWGYSRLGGNIPDPRGIFPPGGVIPGSWGGYSRPGGIFQAVWVDSRPEGTFPTGLGTSPTRCACYVYYKVKPV